MCSGRKLRRHLEALASHAILGADLITLVTQNVYESSFTTLGHGRNYGEVGGEGGSDLGQKSKWLRWAMKYYMISWL